MAHPPFRPLLHRAACGLALLAACAQAQAGSEPLIGALMPMAAKVGSACPAGWMQAAGQQLPIQAYQELFAVLGTVYGGNGETTFALPNLGGRTPVGVGQGPGLTLLARGQQGGSTGATLAADQLPPHGLMAATTAAATHATPGSGRALAQAQNAGTYASSGTPVALGQSSVAGGDGSVPVPTMSPYLAIFWCIAVKTPPSP